MDSVSFKQFQNNLQDCVDRVINRHNPLKVTDTNRSDFVIVSAQDWEQTQETLYILQNTDLMQQISQSLATHTAHKGYQPSAQELDEILGV